jgi:riboflavin biosynthesis pyrimidine reductase
LQHDWLRRFEQFAARKTRLATTASLPPYRTQLDDPDANALTVGNAWTNRLFDGPFYLSPAATPVRPACSLVFVQSSDGNTSAADPGALGGGETDSHLIFEGLSRVAADAVLAGAQTVRGSDVMFSVWHPQLVDLRMSLGLSRHPVQIVATLRGIELADTMLFNLPAVRVLLLAVPAAAERMSRAIKVRPWITLLLMEGPGDVQGAFERLRSIGIARISCVGGRTLAGHLLDEGLIDDVYLTTGRKTGGEGGTPLSSASWRGRTVVRKAGTGVEQGVIFEHLLPSRRRLCVRIGDLDSVDPGPWCQRVRPRPHAAGDLAHCDPSDAKGVRDERAMTAPWNGLSAHQHDPRVLCELNTPIQTASEFRGLHVVGIPPEACIPPPTVHRIPPRVAQSSQARHVPVPDPRSTQGAREELPTELRVVP